MKTFGTALLILCFARQECYPGAGKAQDFDTFVARLNGCLAGGGWEVTTDFSAITIVRRHLRCLHDFQLPTGSSDEEKWKEYSFESNYILTITFDTELTQQEYDLLYTTKTNLMANRLRGIDRRSVEHYSAAQAAKGVVLLPQYHWSSRSVYVYSSDDGNWQLRPALVAEQRDKVFALIDRTFTKYQARQSEPTASPNAAPPHR
jgi:hypothetical protein